MSGFASDARLEPPNDSPFAALCHVCNPDHAPDYDEEGHLTWSGQISEDEFAQLRQLAAKRGFNPRDYQRYPVCPDHFDEVYPEGGPDMAESFDYATQCVLCGDPLATSVNESVRALAAGLSNLFEDEAEEQSEPEDDDESAPAGKGAVGKDGIVFYQGPSELDGKPIVAIATGLKRTSNNVKTGPMVQTWIMRQDENPVAAVKTGADASVCGSCIHRLIGRSRTCYVNVGQAPNAVWKGWKRGIYPGLEDFDPSWITKPRPLRRGSYGDPAAVPQDAWDALQAVVHPKGSEGGTGYTHQWKTAPGSLAGTTMASVDSPEEREQAKAKGYRTFRVRKQSDPLLPGEINCPASEEGGHRTTCDKCKLCSGAGPMKPKKDIAIIGHGAVAQKKYHDLPKDRESKPAPKKAPPAQESTRATTRRLFNEGHRAH